MASKIALLDWKATSRPRRWLILGGAAIIIVGLIGWESGRILWRRNHVDIDIVRQVAQSVPCALVSVEAGVKNGTMAVTGLASRDAEKQLREVVAAKTKAPITWQLSTFDGPYCSSVELVRLANGPTGTARGFETSLPDHRTSFADGEGLIVDVKTPDFPAYLTIDYVMSDGSVLHISPGKQYPVAKYRAGARVRFGQPSGGFSGWTFQEPFGRDMLVAVASTVPLAAKATSSPSGYVTGVRDEVSISVLLGEQVTATVILVDTQRKR